MMPTPEERRRAEEVFESVLELPPNEREEFIRKECGADTPLAAEVLLLVAHYEAAPPDFLQSPAADSDQMSSLESIGPYELKEVLGEGGMGVVYRAEQKTPVARTVAVKILKLGMDSREILNRFEAERQALARLEHPNIARVYDAGTTPDGRPYFVMEYIKGQSITTYCDDHRLTPRQRIELFTKLCRGVQYAHQQGIIHRDLKPMNILVAEVDGVIQPKVIDFGVAKAVQQNLTEATLYTRKGQLIGTPEYMSPEQAEAAPVDTRTDVYSLGVVLYELLAGVLPIDAKTLRQAGFNAMMRLIREQDPQRPSTRVNTLDGAATTVAECRSVEPRVLARTLRGDLDWIALKALEKDPERRYSTVAELAADLQRHLADRPVTARPASMYYLLGKFARRHRVGVGIALTVLGAVVILGVNMTLQAKRVARERDRANHEAVVSRQVKDFLVDIFLVSDPNEARGDSVSAREILDRGARRIGELEDDATRAELAGALAVVYQNLGLYDQSDSLFVAAKDIWLESEGLDHPGTLSAVGSVAGVYKALGRLAEAESLYTVAVEGWERLGLAEDLRALDTAARLASVHRRMGHYVKAETVYLVTIEKMRGQVVEDDEGLLLVRTNLAFCYSNQGQYAEAAVIYEDVLQIQRRAFPEYSPPTLRTMSSLGFVYSMMGRYVEAEALLFEARDGRKRVLGENHPDYFGTLSSLGNLYLQQDDLPKAAAMFEKVLVWQRGTRGVEHPSTLVAMHNFAEIQNEMGHYERAEALATETLALRVRLRGDEHPYTQQTRFLMAKTLARRGAYDEAVEHLQIAMKHGFADSVAFTSEAFDPLRGRADFEALQVVNKQRLDTE